MSRKKLTKKEDKGGLYFDEERPLSFINTGCTVLNNILGGGYVQGRIINVVGDKSTSKTGAGIELSANFLRDFPEGRVVYAESEGAFDKPYGASMGMPVDKVEFRELNEETGEDNSIYTVEDLYNDLVKVCDQSDETKQPVVYILDSLDALSDEAEQKRDISDSTYGQNKAKQMSQLFRRITKRMKHSNVTLFIISQTRDNIGVTFGASYARSGGKALDFYASQIIYLARVKNIKKIKNKIERIVGIALKAKCTKNKAGRPFRECSYNYVFNYGIDDITANIDFLDDYKILDDYTDKTKKTYMTWLNSLSDDDYFKETKNLSNHVTQIWNEIEETFAPVRSKY